MAEVTVPDLERPVQRSASWKNDIGTSHRFDRNSERRKTCLPIVRTGANRWQQHQDAGLQGTQRKEQEEPEAPVVVEVAGEEVELVPGKVQKVKKGK